MEQETKAAEVPKQPKPLRVSDAIIKRHADMAADAFKEHVCTERLNQGMFRSWRCQRPHSWTYGFDVVTYPGHLVVTGDLGDLIVTRCEDMIAWARSAIRDPGYFSEKVPQSLPTREWSFDKSVEWINEEIQEADDRYGDETHASIARKKLDALLQELKTGGMNGEMDEHEFSLALWESRLVDGCDWPNLKVFNSNFLWCREAVKWLLAHLPEEDSK